METIDLFSPINFAGDYEVWRYQSSGYTQRLQRFDGNVNHMTKQFSYNTGYLGYYFANTLKTVHPVTLPVADTPARAWATITYLAQDIELSIHRSGGTFVVANSAMIKYLTDNKTGYSSLSLGFIVDESMDSRSIIVAYRGLADADAGLVSEVINGVVYLYNVHPLDWQYYRYACIEIQPTPNQDVNLNWFS